MNTVRRMLGIVLWYVRELSGETEYDRYCERHRRHHPHAPLPTRREYQRMRTARRECESPGRCC
ncbi:CstA-like transporter-associated (seleno)protein [Streptomyces sp. bgisy032]|uniref:CstA-like transporter-associated (seleno)protein n=1 Tax=Streptomyces sp. bgisy032 TaxID=3413773 RepID=UPI003D70C216